MQVTFPSSPRFSSVQSARQPALTVAQPSADQVTFGMGGKKLRRGGAIAALLLVLGGVTGCSSSGPSDNATNADVYQVQGTKTWSYVNFDFHVDETHDGWEIRGKKKGPFGIPEPTGYHFTVKPIENGWHIEGKKDYTIGKFHADIVRTADGWKVDGDQDYTPIGGGFHFDETKTADGFTISGKEQFTIGHYDFKVQRTSTGWQLTGGHNWSFQDFNYQIDQKKEIQEPGSSLQCNSDPAGTTTSQTGIDCKPGETSPVTNQKEEGFVTAFPVILSMIHDKEEQAAESSNN